MPRLRTWLPSAPSTPRTYLVTEKGIDASRISVVTSVTDGKAVEDYLVPSGADFSADVTGDHPGG